MRKITRSCILLGLFVTTTSLGAGFACSDTTNTTDTGGTGASNTGGAAGQGGTGLGGEGGSFIPAVSSSGMGGSGGDGGAGGAGGGNQACVFVPTAGTFNAEMECAWNGSTTIYTARDDVVSTPVVINLTDDDGDGMVTTDDIPDIAFIAYRYQEDGCCNQPGLLRVLSGACNPDGTMTEHFAVGATEIEADTNMSGIWLDNSGGLAAGDIDADGSPDLVATTNNGGTIAFERTGKVKWYQPAHPGAANRDHLAGTTPSIADIDHDGNPEIIQGRVVLNGADGTLKWAGKDGTGVNAFMGPVSSVGDPDLDGTMNVLAGNTMYSIDGQPIWTYTFAEASTSTNCAAPAGYTCDGYTATGNFDDDDFGEIVIVRAGKVYILNHDGTPLQVGGQDVIVPIPVAGCSKNEGGPPTVADFDGDGQAEIGVAAANYYIVADLECLATPLPANCSDNGIRWKVANEDCSSRVTGSSVFDFDGDGKAEVVYNDETTFRVMDGTTGTVILSKPNHSHTRLEMPIVADVDNDGNAEIVFIENAYGGMGQGIRIWGDANDSWVPTRRIWNQHAYHVTNVMENGAIPQFEKPNWLENTTATKSGKMNNFRQNLPEFDVYAAPDLSLTLMIDKTYCPTGLGLTTTVCNDGAVVVGSGIPITFYNNANMMPIMCKSGSIVTTKSLGPGKCQTLVCEWTNAPYDPETIDVRACVDNEGYACTQPTSGANNECREDNNQSNSGGVGCKPPG